MVFTGGMIHGGQLCLSFFVNKYDLQMAETSLFW